MEKYEENLMKAIRTIETADHMVYVTYPLIKDKKLLLRILDEIYQGLLAAINAILQYEYYYKRITIYNNPKDNFTTFREISPGYKITEDQISRIIEIFRLIEIHKKSPFEFSKGDKIVIMSDGMKTDTITLDRIKFFLLEAKDILRKARNVIVKRI